MYLKQAAIENSGSIISLNLNLKFNSEGLPQPLILVGGNGGGKTNFLATVADALFEAAAVHYGDVLQTQPRGRAWFRTVGGRSITLGAAGGFSLLRFEEEGVSLFYKEKAGNVDPNAAATRIPADFAEQVKWRQDELLKKTTIINERSRLIFENGVYTYFPSSRSEIPYWMNKESIIDINFDTSPKISKQLKKPIYVERAIERFKQWLISLLSDTRTNIVYTIKDGKIDCRVAGNTKSAISSSIILEYCNTILRAILLDDRVSFVWTGRKSSEKVAVAKNERLFLPSLDALSAGQSIMLGMFGTLLQYSDLSQSGESIIISSIKGICLIDEIDAHIHVEPQYNVLPKLIKMFPSIQFIVSSHSPLFVLGMEHEFGVDGIQVIDMPSGLPVGAESYSEFGKALDILAATKAFNKKISDEMLQDGKPIIYVEGETDAPYLKRAAVLLNRTEILNRCEIEWIGAKDESGQAFHTGKDALKHTLSVLKANPLIARRNILLLHDNDSGAPSQDYEGFSVRRIPINPQNNKVTAGIENLLTAESIGDEFYQTKENFKSNGDIITSRSIRKAALCAAMDANGTTEQFLGFGPALDVIEDYLNMIGS